MAAYDNDTLKQAGSVENLYKNLGETPRERLDRLRTQKPHFAHEVLSYAGRLDPMAEGVMLCLVGSANNRREEYLNLNKEYTLDVLFGFSTDSYDLLGKIIEIGEIGSLTPKSVKEALAIFKGNLHQEYPPYSSKPVNGKPLFEWARKGALASIILPSRTVEVFSISIVHLYKIKESDLLAYIERCIEKVTGDFRQEEILRLWKQNVKQAGKREFPCASISISCSSGTYARSIAHNLGVELGVPALALHILRTKVGEYDIEKSLK